MKPRPRRSPARVAKAKPNWASLVGKFEFGADVTFLGQAVKQEDKTFSPLFGLAVTDQRLTDGTLSVTVEFDQFSQPHSSAELVVHRDLSSSVLVTAGIGLAAQFVIRVFDGYRETVLSQFGDRGNVKSKVPYRLSVKARGSQLTLSCDGVDVCTATTLPQWTGGQVGLLCADYSPIQFKEFALTRRRAQVFAVMQFSSPYNEIYSEVIKSVCKDLEVRVLRADESYTTGLVIADVTRQIRESHVVIAEISPANPNVYYEVGYAHALGKPTILLADAGSERLPFDVSGFRTVFYENSIAGKRKVEEALRKHLNAILRGES